MEDLDLKQKIKIVGILIIIVGVIVFYFYKQVINSEENNQQIWNEIEEPVEKIEDAEEVIEEVVVHITGEVKQEGVVRLKIGSRIIDAIEAAGGSNPEANLSIVNLAQILEDGQKIYIPNINETIEQDEMYSIQSNGYNSITEDNTKGGNKLVNINTATQAELEGLPGIGPATAEKIIEYREENGKFKEIEELKNVSGIGEAKYEKVKENICVK